MTIEEAFEKKRSLKELTTFGVGGTADLFITVQTVSQMQEALGFCAREQLPYFVLGKGSNTLFDDKGFEGVVIANRIQFLNKSEEGSRWHVGAGYSFSLLGHQTAREEWTGLEFASGIPGSVGGAVFMNAGAGGAEVCQTLASVDYVHLSGQCQQFQREELPFSYRTSPFQSMEGAIVGATFQLSRKEGARQKQIEIIDYRKKTQPYSAKSAGCVFRNPEGAHAGALIEQCGLKGKRVGQAEVSDVHANFVVNIGEASAKEILELIAMIRDTVKEKTGYDLESEVRYIPHKK